MRPLETRNIVVTGGGRGLGRAYAIALAEAGASVVVNDIDEKVAQLVCEEIAARGGAACCSNHSVTDATAVEAMMDLCVNRFGSIDGLVNNAGLFHAAHPGEEDPDRARRLIEVNVLGVLFCGLAAIRRMLVNNHGVVVNIASGAALGIPQMSTYGASKGAVLSLTRGWALDLADTGVRVVGVSPVAVTRMSAQHGPPSAGGSQPEEIAPLIVYLMSDASSHLNGTVVRLSNGELSILRPAAFGPILGMETAWNIRSLGLALAAP